MQTFQPAFKFLIYTGTPVICCALVSFILPETSTIVLLVIGLLAAVVSAFTLYRRVNVEVDSLSQGLLDLKQNLISVNDAVQRRESSSFSSQKLLDNHVQVFQDLSFALRDRIQVLISSNETLTHSYTQFQSILATMAEGVILVEPGRKILYCNRSAGILMGRESADVSGKELVEILRTPSLDSAIDLAFSTKQELNYEFELQRTNSIVKMSAVPLDSDSGVGMLIVLHDVTELRRLEKMRREFVSNVSHELKTPLTAIQAYADTLLEGGLEDTENSRLFVERIQEQSDRLQQMIEDMLRLARIESQADAFQLQPVSITKIVEFCVDARLAVARARNISLNYDYQDEGGKIVADEVGLRTIFENLINNALNYTPENGNVDVRCWFENHHAIVEVKDDGVGISQEHHTRIFERFYRVDEARTRGTGGTGLGLAIVKHCVGVFGGEIDIESEVGQGTTFRVHFPLSEKPLQAVHAV